MVRRTANLWRRIVAPVFTISIALVFILLAWQAPLHTLPTKPLTSWFSQCNAGLRSAEPGADKRFLLTNCETQYLLIWQGQFITRLQVFQSYAEIAEGFAMAAATVLLARVLKVPLWLKKSLSLPRLPFMVLASVGFGFFIFFEGASIAFAYTHDDLIRDVFFHLLPNPAELAVLGLAWGAVCIGLLRSKFGLGLGVKSGILAFALPAFAAQVALAFLDFSEMSLYVTRAFQVSQWFLLPPYSFWNPWNQPVGIPVGVPLLSNWFVLIAAGSLFLVALFSITTSASSLVNPRPMPQ